MQVFLAKIAGKDVDVSTLTPPVAINEEERLMLDIADRIDAIEEGGGGGGGGVIVVTATYDDETGVTTLDKTWQEIYDGIYNGVVVMVFDQGTEEEPYVQMFLVDEAYYDEHGGPDGTPAYVVANTQEDSYWAETPSDYPTYQS